MLPRLWRVSRAVSFVALALALLVLVPPAEATQTKAESSMTIRLISRVVSSRVVDTPPKNVPNKGDVVYLRDALSNQVAQFGKAKGALVGHDNYVGTILSATRAKVRVQVTLPGGTLTVAGPIANSATNSGIVPVVGGTGRFAHARGTCSVRDRGSYSINVYRLRLP